MRMRFVVTGITAVNDARLFVQLAGECGNIQLNLPRSEQTKLRVGQEFILSDIDEGESPAVTNRPLGGRRISLED